MAVAMQRSFAGGELGPALWARSDQVKYQIGLRLCRNFLVQRFGGVTNRPGSEFVCEVYDSTKPARLLPFVYNAEQTYILALSDHVMWIARDGAPLTLPTAAWNSATAYVPNDFVRHLGVIYFCSVGHTNQAPPNVTYWTPLAAAYQFNGERLAYLALPYAAEDLRAINHVQSADVMTLVHPDYSIRELSRTSDTAWSIAAMALTPSQARPTALAGTPGAAGSNVYRYRVTAINQDYEESLVAVQAPVTITGATTANPCVITATAHGYENGEDVLIESVGGMPSLNNKVYRVANKAANTFELQGVDATGYGTYTSGGTAKRTSVRIVGAAPTSGAPHVLTWTAPAGAWRYNVYKEQAGIYGYIGTSEVATFSDTNFTPATSYTPPGEQTVFSEPGDYPATVAYYQQRLAFAATLDKPEKFWLSRTGQFSNYTRSQPVQSDDAITFTLAGRQVRHLVEVGTLIALTAAGEFTIGGDSDGVLRPTAINPKQQGYNGAAAQPAPVIVGNSVLFVQARGGIVRDLRYEYQADGYQGSDLTVFAPHLFEGHTIVAWAYQQVPHSIVWAVRSDGVLLGLTYLREHEVSGWHRHDTGDGDLVEDVCVVPEGDEDAVYILVRRLVDGTWRRYVERLASRRVDDIADAVFLDSALRYDGRNTGATTLTLSGGTTWDETEVLTLTASASQFVADDVGNSYVLTVGEDEIWCNVVAYTSGTVVSVIVDQVAPASMRGVALTTWARAVDEVAGLDHLEGRTVGILADGSVLPEAVVSGGAVDLGHPYIRITVGLPYVSEIETLDIEDPQASLIEKRKRINRVTLLVESSRGVFAGPDRDHLREWKQRAAEAWGEPTRLHTGQVEIPITGSWTPGGSLVIRQADPLPLTVLAIAAGGETGGG